jgi:hypothetical protein
MKSGHTKTSNGPSLATPLGALPESAEPLSPSSSTTLVAASSSTQHKRFTAREISALKEQAKRLTKASTASDTKLTHSAALDQVAMENGYRNWSLLQKKASAGRISEAPVASSENPLHEDLVDMEVQIADLHELNALQNEVIEATEEYAGHLKEMVHLLEDELAQSKASKPKTKSSKGTKETKPKFKTLTQLGKLFALTPAKVKNVLVANGFIGVDHRPTAAAWAAEACLTRKTDDKFLNRGEVEYFVWDLAKVEACFEKPDEVALASHVKNRHQVCSRLHEAIEAAARSLGYPGEVSEGNATEEWKAQSGLSEHTLEVITASHFRDMHDTGFHMDVLAATTRKEVDNVFGRIESVIIELERALGDKKPSAAKLLRGVVTNLKAWMLRNTI